MFSNDATPLSGGDLSLGKLGLRFTCPSTWKRCVCGLSGPLEAMGNSRDAADESEYCVHNVWESLAQDVPSAL